MAAPCLHLTFVGAGPLDCPFQKTQPPLTMSTTSCWQRSRSLRHHPPCQRMHCLFGTQSAAQARVSSLSGKSSQGSCWEVTRVWLVLCRVFASCGCCALQHPAVAAACVPDVLQNKVRATQVTQRGATRVRHAQHCVPHAVRHAASLRTRVNTPRCMLPVPAASPERTITRAASAALWAAMDCRCVPF